MERTNQPTPCITLTTLIGKPIGLLIMTKLKNYIKA